MKKIMITILTVCCIAAFCMENGKNLLSEKWSPYNSGIGKVVIQTDGTIICELSECGKENASGASQTIILNQKTPKAIYVSAECKAEKVLGNASKNFSIYMDIKHTDGSQSWGEGLNFTPGTYDWKKFSVTYVPKKPIKSINFLLLLRYTNSGKALFKNVVCKELELTEISAEKMLKKFGFIPLYKHNGTIEIETLKTPQNKEIEFPAVKRKPGYRVCLYFRPYLKTLKPAGWNNYLVLDLNSSTLAEFTEYGTSRLLRRGPKLQNTYRDHYTWWRNNAWLVYFNDGKQDLDPRIIAPREEMYDYWMDISDYVNYLEIGSDNRIEKSIPNKLLITNAFTSAKSLPCPNMVLEDIQIGYVENTEIEKGEGMNLKKVHILPSPGVKEFHGKNYSAIVTEGGDLIIKSNEDIYFFKSEFSYVNETSPGFNCLSSECAHGISGWIPSISFKNNGTIKIESASATYTLTRIISIEKEKLVVKDSFHNTSSKAIGIILKYSTITNETPSGYKLSGMDCNYQSMVAGNPTIFIRQKNSSLGIIAEDNVLRLQTELRKEGLNSFAMSDEHFGLKPGNSYIVERSIYPLQAKEYFDFINLIRKERNLNQTITGPLIFNDDNIPVSLNFSIVISGPWYSYCCGGGKTGKIYSKQLYADYMKNRVNRLRKAYPECKILARMETDLVTFDRAKIKDGDKLPTSNRSGTGRYGYELSTEETKILMADPEVRKYADSMMFTEDGRAIVDNYYPPEPFINIIVKPVVGNYRYKEMLEQLDFMLDKLNFDGVYLDQFAPIATYGGQGRFTYQKWDGYTVDINKKGEVIRKYCDFGLVGASARKNIIEYILAKNKILVANSNPIVSETINLRGLRFNEQENDSLDFFLLKDTKPPCGRNQTLTHLSSSPITLGVRPERYISKDMPDLRAKALMRGIITALRNGVLYFYYHYQIPFTGEYAGDYGPCSHMYPFTPVELNEGFLIGKERIITCISKGFTFNSNQQPKIFLFDKYGKEKAHNFQGISNDGKWEVNIKLDDWNEIAVIEFQK